jgi:hypothetical protein
MDCRKQLVFDRAGRERFAKRSKGLECVLTIVGGKPVYAAEEFADLAPAMPPVLPDWSPVAAYGGYHKPAAVPAMVHSHAVEHRCHERENSGGMGCLCWAF